MAQGRGGSGGGRGAERGFKMGEFESMVLCVADVHTCI